MCQGSYEGRIDCASKANTYHDQGISLSDISQLQQEQRSLSEKIKALGEMTRARDDLQSDLQHMVSCTEVHWHQSDTPHQSTQVQEAIAAKNNILVQLSNEKESVENARKEVRLPLHAITTPNLYILRNSSLLLKICTAITYKYLTAFSVRMSVLRLKQTRCV